MRKLFMTLTCMAMALSILPAGPNIPNHKYGWIAEPDGVTSEEDIVVETPELQMQEKGIFDDVFNPGNDSIDKEFIYDDYEPVRNDSIIDLFNFISGGIYNEILGRPSRPMFPSIVVKSFPDGEYWNAKGDVCMTINGNDVRLDFFNNKLTRNERWKLDIDYIDNYDFNHDFTLYGTIRREYKFTRSSDGYRKSIPKVTFDFFRSNTRYGRQLLRSYSGTYYVNYDLDTMLVENTRTGDMNVLAIPGSVFSFTPADRYSNRTNELCMADWICEECEHNGNTYIRGFQH